MAYVIRLLLVMLALWLVRRGVAYLRRRLLAVPERPRPDVGSPWEVLELQPGASPDQIEASWRRLIHDNHPDRVAHMDPEIQALAARRTQAINEAYAALKGRRAGPG